MQLIFVVGIRIRYEYGLCLLSLFFGVSVDTSLISVANISLMLMILLRTFTAYDRNTKILPFIHVYTFSVVHLYICIRFKAAVLCLHFYENKIVSALLEMTMSRRSLMECIRTGYS